MPKVEMTDDRTYRLVDGEEDTPTYIDGTIAEWGEPSILEKPGEDAITFLIDENGCSDGKAYQNGVALPVSFELGCEFEDEDEDDEEDEEDEPK
jgi:hypothetical protein